MSLPGEKIVKGLFGLTPLGNDTIGQRITSVSFLKKARITDSH
jgi:hypothetical protein